jgi:hypothetical protein
MAIAAPSDKGTPWREPAGVTKVTPCDCEEFIVSL